MLLGVGSMKVSIFINLFEMLCLFCEYHVSWQVFETASFAFGFCSPHMLQNVQKLQNFFN